MKLNLFLGSAKNINKVKIINAWDDSKVIYEGSYSEFSHNINELGLNDSLVMSWYVEGDKVFIEISTY